MLVFLKNYKLSIFLAIFISLFAACSTPTLPNPTATLLATSLPSLTLTASPTITRTPTPSITPSSTQSPTPTFLPITPVLQGTHLPESGPAISLGNLNRLTLLARWGYGNPGEVAYTPDGKYLVVGSSMGLYIYNSDDFSFVHHIDFQATSFRLAISSDSQLIAAVTGDRVFLYWLSDWSLFQTFPVSANSVDFSPDGKILALGINSDPDYLQLRDVVSGEVIRNFNDEQAAWAVKVSPRGDVIATAGFSTTIWTFDGTMTDQYGPYVSGGHTTSVSFSPDGELLAEASDDALRIWQVLENGRLMNYRQINLRQCASGIIFDTTISPDGKLIAATLSDGVCVWDLSTGAHVFFGPPESGFTFYNGLSWSMDSETLVTTSAEVGVQVWSLATGDILALQNSPFGTYSSLVWSPDGQMLAVGGEEGTTYLLSAQNGDIVHQLGPGFEVNSLAFSPNSQNLAIGYSNRKVQIWDLSGTLLQTLDGFGYGSSDVTYFPDGAFFATSQSENWESPLQILVWDTKNWSVTKAFSIGDQTDFMLTGFVLAPDQLTGAISYVDKRGHYNTDFIQIISIADGKVLTILEPERKEYRVFILSMAYSPDGAQLASLVSEFYDPNPRLLLWDTSDWTLLYEQPIKRGERLGSSSNQQDAISWSADGKLIAIGMMDGSIKILRARNGELLTTLPGHTMGVIGVTFSPDGRILASASLDGTVMLWGIK